MKIMITILVILFSYIGFISCQNSTGVEVEECPDTSFSQDNLDSLEADYIWRICNADEKYNMENIRVYELGASTPQDSLLLGFQELQPCDCSTYFQGGVPINQIDYKQMSEFDSKIYLAHRPVNKGLTDSTLISDTPGRYTYHFNSADSNKASLVIEREAFH